MLLLILIFIDVDDDDESEFIVAIVTEEGVFIGKKEKRISKKSTKNKQMKADNNK